MRIFFQAMLAAAAIVASGSAQAQLSTPEKSQAFQAIVSECTSAVEAGIQFGDPGQNQLSACFAAKKLHDIETPAKPESESIPVTQMGTETIGIEKPEFLQQQNSGETAASPVPAGSFAGGVADTAAAPAAQKPPVQSGEKPPSVQRSYYIQSGKSGSAKPVFLPR